MKTKIILAAAALLLLFAGISVYAAMAFDMTFLPGTTDTVTNLPDTEALTGGEVYTVPSQIPQREGYEFIGWKLDYDVLTYSVTYVVNPDPTYGVPENSAVPAGSRYAPNAQVDVADQLTTEKGYAYNEKGEKVKGTWEFITWDKADFEITEDTTITGAWRFTAAPVTEYNYTVEYWLIDGTKRIAKVADDKHGTVSALGVTVTENAIPMGSKDLYTKYRSPKKYRVKPAWETVTATITKDGYVIYIFYELIPHGQ